MRITGRDEKLYVLENGMAIPHQKVNKEFLCYSTLFTMAKMQSKSPSTEEWINQMWYIHIMEYYSALKRNEIMDWYQHIPIIRVLSVPLLPETSTWTTNHT